MGHPVIAVSLVFLFAQLFDVYTTFRALKAGAREGNPVIASLMKFTGGLWPFIKVLGSIAAAAYLIKQDAPEMVLILAAFVTVVALNNLRIAKDLEDRR